MTEAISTLRCDVLIAGLGPVGAVLAALLGQRDMSVIAVEPQADVYSLPRAAHIDHEIMRIFQTIGISEAIGPHVREAPDYEFRTRDGAMLMRTLRAGVRGASGWAVSYNVYQPGIERAVRAALDALPTVRTILGARFAALVANDADGVVATLDIDGAAVRCEARFLVGCDGASSQVREACGGGLEDYGFDEPWLVLDARVDDESGFPSDNLQICDPERPTSFVHMGPGRLRWEFMIKPGEDAEAMRSDAAVTVLLEPWRRLGRIAVERRAVYRFHGLVARAWRRQGVFLVGDSAHQMPPFMGQGLCSGLRDAANLAWKLAAALRGEATEALLDSYQAERDPHVRDVIEKAIAMGRVVCTLDPERAATRDAAMRAAPRIAAPQPFPPLAAGCIVPGSAGAGTIFPQPRDAQGNALDDWLGADAWLIQRGPTALSTAGVRSVILADMPPAFVTPIADWLDAADADAVLVRPDRYVFGSGDADKLVAAYTAWFGTRRHRPARHGGVD